MEVVAAAAVIGIRRLRSLTLQVRVIQILIPCLVIVYGWEAAASPSPSPPLVYLRSRARLSSSSAKLHSDMACTDLNLSHGLPCH